MHLYAGRTFRGQCEDVERGDALGLGVMRRLPNGLK